MPVLRHAQRHPPLHPALLVQLIVLGIVEQEVLALDVLEPSSPDEPLGLADAVVANVGGKRVLAAAAASERHVGEDLQVGNGPVVRRLADLGPGVLNCLLQNLNRGILSH